MRDVILTLGILAALPACFQRPFFGLLMFSWLAYMRAQDLCWGFARYQRFSLFVAVAMFGGYLVFGGNRFMARDVRNRLMLALVALVSCSILFSPFGINEYVTGFWADYIKIVAVALFTTGVVTTRERLRILVWTIALSLGFYGVKIGLWGVLTGGHAIKQGPGGLIQDNNDFSLALTMNLPFLFYLGLSEPSKWVRRALYGAMGLTVVTILLTHSRGGFLAMCTTLALMTWRSRNRVVGFSLAGVAAVLFLMLAPSSVFERISSIKTYEEDGSARARLKSWGLAVTMMKQHPVFGVGFRNYTLAYAKYDPEPVFRTGGTQETYVAHNSYLQIGAESGVPALAVYLVMFGSTLALLRWLRRVASLRYYSGWILNYVRMFEASLIGFMVGAVFLNRAHFDLAYHIVGITIAFAAIAKAELASETKYPLRESAMARVAPAKGFAGSGRQGRTEAPLGGARAPEPAPAPGSFGKPRPRLRSGFGFRPSPR